MSEEIAKPKLLIIEDEEQMASGLKVWLERHFHVDICKTVSEGISKLTEDAYRVAIVDMAFGDDDKGGMSIVTYVTENDLATKVIVLTAYGSIDNCRDSMKCGVFDYIEKARPQTNERILKSALEAAELGRQVSFELSPGNIETIKHLQKEIGSDDIVGVFREGLRILRWAVEEWKDNRLIASIKDTKLKVYPNLIEGGEN